MAAAAPLEEKSSAIISASTTTTTSPMMPFPSRFASEKTRESAAYKHAMAFATTKYLSESDLVYELSLIDYYYFFIGAQFEKMLDFAVTTSFF